MLGIRSVLVSAVMGVLASGCATVAMVEAKSETIDISLTESSSELHSASDTYCEKARDKGWATGETSLGSLAGILTGKNLTENAYWRKIGADRGPPANTLTRVRADATEAAKGLNDLSSIAQAMAANAKGKPSKADVSDFERALIHARQARESFSDAIAEVNRRTQDQEFYAVKELEPLDKALAAARTAADDLAAARTSDKGSLAKAS